MPGAPEERERLYDDYQFSGHRTVLRGNYEKTNKLVGCNPSVLEVSSKLKKKIQYNKKETSAIDMTLPL